MSQDHFVIPVKYYIFTFVSLLVLTVITVYTAKYVHVNDIFNLALALVIASVKALLVLGFFMGLRWDKGINIAFISFGILFFFFFISFTLLDVATRDSIVVEEKGLVDYNTPVKIEGEEPK